MITKSIAIVCGVLIVIAIYFPQRHAKKYNYIKDEDVLCELLVNLKVEPNLQNCTYKDSILNGFDVDIDSVYDRNLFEKPRKGGEFIPNYCAPQFKTAVIIPYRNRIKQLNIFLNYMHWFLQQQNIWYRIFVVDQNDSFPFNRARMLNYGAQAAMDANFDCLILHDVDLIPINTGNIYACSKSPRHMSSSLDTFRYNLPYDTLFGGAVSISSQQFESVNGMSNLFYGWGGEDDDFYNRLKEKGLDSYRFSPKISKYIMLAHKKEKASQSRWKNLKDSKERMKTDGINSLNNYLVQLNDLYTHVVAS